MKHKRNTQETVWGKIEKAIQARKSGAVLDEASLDEILHDVLTHHKELELQKEELRLVLHKAERSDKLKSIFLNNLSHEIRTPLNAIVGFSEFLNEEEISREQISHLTGIICQSSKQLLNVIDEIVNISTIEAGLVELYESETNLNELLSQLYERFFSTATHKGIRFRLNSRLSETEPIVITDGSKLLHILTNLLDNALKFTDNGHVEFGCLPEKNTLKFYVADTGIGIHPDFHTSIFHRFEQVETEQSSVRGGMGLGLAVARAYAELMGGSIRVESEYGKGAAFFVELPWKRTVRKESTGLNGLAFTKMDGKTILVAEDEENNFELTRVILSDYDMEILHAWDGAQAVEMVKEHEDIALVLMDIKMPIMNGYEATRQIKSMKPTLPVIALTAYALPGDQERALENGCDDYMAKPISIPALLDKVKRYL